MAFLWLESIGGFAHAADSGDSPQRLLMICLPLGIYPDAIPPEGAGRDYEPSEYLSVLDEFRNQTTFISGLDHPGVNGGHSAEPRIFTGVPSNKIDLAQVPVEHRRSPKGRFEMTRQHVSLALRGSKDVGPWGGGHPFDSELATLPPGKTNYPMHAHAAQTEFYIMLSGTGLLYSGDAEPEPLAFGDHVICHPGDAHQIENDGSEPLIFYVISDHHRADVGIYTNTGKRWLSPERRVVSVEDADYYAGEE